MNEKGSLVLFHESLSLFKQCYRSSTSNCKSKIKSYVKMNHCAIICSYDGKYLSYTNWYFEAHSVKVNVYKHMILQNTVTVDTCIEKKIQRFVSEGCVINVKKHFFPALLCQMFSLCSLVRKFS